MGQVSVVWSNWEHMALLSIYFVQILWGLCFVGERRGSWYLKELLLLEMLLAFIGLIVIKFNEI
jgi:hypothetical protein